MAVGSVSYNTYAPLQDADITLTARTIQTSGSTTGYAYVFICPKDYASGDVIRFVVSSGTNTNTGTQNVGAQLYALSAGNWSGGTTVSNIALWPCANATSTFTVTFANGSSTITISPSITTALNVGEYVSFTSTGTLPSNITSGTNYIVLSCTTTSMTIATTPGGTAIVASGAGTPTISATRQNTPATSLIPFGMTTTSALTKGTAYGLRVFPNTTFTAGCSFNAAVASNYSDIQDLQEYHINGVTISTGQPNLSVGDSTQYYGTRCVRRTPQTTTATNTTGTSQVGFSFSLPSGADYSVTEIQVKGLIYSSGGTVTTGNLTGIIYNSANTIIQSSVVINITNTVGTLTSARGSRFIFTSPTSITGGTTYYFAIDSVSDKTLQYLEIDNPTDPLASGGGTVQQLSVVRRNASTGAWTDTTTSQYRAIPLAKIVADVTDTSVSTGGLKTHPGMSGGMRG